MNFPDGDNINDGVDPLPVTFNYTDGDLAPLGSPDGLINGADILVSQRIIMGDVTAGNLELSHGDLYPVGAPDGVINIQDHILLLQLLLP